MSDNIRDITKLLNTILLRAVKEKAADIHFEPFEKDYRIRYRIDGSCHDAAHLSWDASLAIGLKIKTMANLDIKETKRPQEGKMAVSLEGENLEFIVSVLPTLYGETIVLKIVDKNISGLSLDQLGIGKDIESKIKETIKGQSGIFIVAGPSGSGKTTTLYSCLREINKTGLKIITAEDIVEHSLDGVVQIAVNTKKAFGFAKTLEHILKQDPDVVMLGEMMDAETTAIAAQSAIAGRLVLSALYAKDSLSVIARLMDMGIEPFLISSSVKAVLAQRLVGKICQKCKKEYKLPERERSELDISKEKLKGIKFYKGGGCPECNGSGYKGRVCLCELLTIDDNIRDLIVKDEGLFAIRKAARETGMETIKENGFKKAMEGITTIEEVLRESKEVL